MTLAEKYYNRIKEIQKSFFSDLGFNTGHCTELVFISIGYNQATGSYYINLNSRVHPETYAKLKAAGVHEFAKNIKFFDILIGDGYIPYENGQNYVIENYVISQLCG
jgi:hypothetical protein